MVMMWYDGLSTQVKVGVYEGLKHDSSMYCDVLVSIPKIMHSHFVGTLSPLKQDQLDEALKAALEVM